MAQSKFWESLGKLDSVAEKTGNPTNSGVVSTKTTETINSSASSKEIADRANARAGHYLEKIDAETADLPVQMNLSTALSSQLLSEEGDYIGAVRAILQGDNALSFATAHEIGNSDTFRNLYSKEHGNEYLDEKTIEMIGAYAAYGEKKRSWTNWSKHKADGIVDDGEVAKAINKIDSFSGNKARSDYINNNRESYFAELHKLLIDVFGNLTITID